MPRQTLDQRLAALRGFATTAPETPAQLSTVRDALRSASGLLVASAAKIVAEHTIYALVEELAPAFQRLVGGEDVAKRDPGCRGKLAVAKALHALDRWDEEVFVVGLRLEQREGWGGADDTAAELRGVCGMVYAHFARPEALDVLARLLADKEIVCRVAAAHGLRDAGRRDASALLRYKILVEPDEDPDVIAACFEALFQLSPDESFAFARELLPPHDERASAAALAIGASRNPDAFDALVRWAEACVSVQRERVAFLAVALLRTEQATQWLLDAMRKRGRPDALYAATALATFKDDPAIAEAMRGAVRDQIDAHVRRALEDVL